NAPETKDNDFTWKDFQARNNNELLAVFGNFVNRTLVLTQKYYDGIVPDCSDFGNISKETLDEIAKFPQLIGSSIERYRFREALNELMNLARLGNKYLTDMEPWKLAKSDPKKVKEIMVVSLQIVTNLAILSEPFLPFTSKKLSNLLNIKEYKWKEAGSADILKAGHKINKPELLFERIEDSTIEQQVQKLMDTKLDAQEQLSANPAKSEIEFDDFMKMDIRTGTILEAEKVAKTKKLLKLVVDTGIDKRTVVSGIAEYYDAEKIVGKKVSILVNLAPRKLRGVESQGMILMAEDTDGKLCFVSPVDDVQNGSEIK
ncbi:MAG: methionine--tRNA ligase subunit beta, partial [Lentimicrobiaceae bacterium]|nr:methionine--tRNA ligase subunit beta [Lentimicrobiaceae bacterium]